MSIQAAFDQVCADAKQPETWYVCLMTDRPYYGGPEEGGWWGADRLVVAYKAFPTEDQAQVAADAVKALASSMAEEARTAYGEHCLATMDWCDERGLDADYLPEPDGPEDYWVEVCQEVPSPHYGPRHYE